MSVYGGLVPLGFSHSNNLRLYLQFLLSYHKAAPFAICFFDLAVFSIESGYPLCYNKSHQPGKQVKILYETVAVRRARLLF